MLRQYELVETVKGYDPDADEDILNKAYVYAMQKHGTQLRASGDPYFSHPIEVAGILTGLKLDTDTIVTALLHDTIEDTDATLEDIEKRFGKNIGRLVDGVTKLSQIEFKSSEAKQAENFRKLVLAMSEDIRVLLVKLADRLHNMQTLHFIKKPEKRQRIALETLEIYAPLAERLGMQDMRDQLQDLSFRELYPDARESILKRLEFLRDNGASLKDAIVETLRADLHKAGVSASVYGREKKPYSIWRKMQRKNVMLEQLSDIMAFRVSVADVAACYAALGVMHSTYSIVPGRFKDYISIPKANGYQSLHTTVIGPKNQRIEIQIRTQDMHDVAELGVAAHWAYKQDSHGTAMAEGRQYQWLRELLDVLEQASTPEEFLEHTKMAMFQDQVFCFSPKGDLIALPRGATPIDFAYAVHSRLGDTCARAKVNGKLVPLRTALHNGDQVEIETEANRQPSPDWEQFVVTAKAKARIRRFVRTQRREQYGTLGKSMLEKTFREAGKGLVDSVLETVLPTWQLKELEDLFVSVGEGHRSAREVLLLAYPELARPQKNTDALPAVLEDRKPRETPGYNGTSVNTHHLPIRGLIPGMAVHYARCCHPVPGDRIVGIISTGRGVTIHTHDCENLLNFRDQPERQVDVAWNTVNETSPNVGRLHLIIDNTPGSLGNVCTSVAQSKANIHHFKITNRTVDFYEILLDVEVHDTSHLSSVMAALRSLREVGEVERMRG